MLKLYRSGRDVGREMIKLTTWLGHANPAHTYLYLEAVPELLELTSARITGAGAEIAPREAPCGWPLPRRRNRRDPGKWMTGAPHIASV
jgi:hypothetical protein